MQPLSLSFSLSLSLSLKRINAVARPRCYMILMFKTIQTELLFLSTYNNNVCFTKPSEEMKLMMMLSKTNILQANGEIKMRILTKNIFVFL